MASTLMQFFLKLNDMCNSTQLNTKIICRDLYLKGWALANTKLEFSALCVSNLQQENRLNGRIQLNFLNSVFAIWFYYINVVNWSWMHWEVFKAHTKAVACCFNTLVCSEHI